MWLIGFILLGIGHFLLKADLIHMKNFGNYKEVFLVFFFFLQIRSYIIFWFNFLPLFGKVGENLYGFLDLPLLNSSNMVKH